MRGNIRPLPSSRIATRRTNSKFFDAELCSIGQTEFSNTLFTTKLGKRESDKFVDAPWKYTVEVSDAVISSPLDDRDVSAIYDATGLLLILGEPDSGKTTTRALSDSNDTSPSSTWSTWFLTAGEQERRGVGSHGSAAFGMQNQLVGRARSAKKCT
jgi:hypothetical protein